MTEKAKELLSKFDHNLNGVLFDLVDENETLEGQVDELREQVARLTEKNESSEDWYKLFCEKWNEGEWIFNVPEGMTNGEVMNLVLRKIFPRTIFIRGNDPCYKIKSINYSEEWENTPYKAEKGGEEK